MSISQILCRFCNKSFTLESMRCKHEKIKHGVQGTHKCPKCNQLFREMCGLNIHLGRMHSARSNKYAKKMAPEDKVNSTEITTVKQFNKMLNKMVMEKPKEDKKLASICKSRSTQKSLCRELKFGCQYCSESFISFAQRRAHELINHCIADKFRCFKCKGKFISEAAMTKHVKLRCATNVVARQPHLNLPPRDTFLDDTRLSCQRCLRTYCSVQYRRDHERLEHGIRHDSKTLIESSSDVARDLLSQWKIDNGDAVQQMSVNSTLSLPEQDNSTVKKLIKPPVSEIVTSQHLGPMYVCPVCSAIASSYESLSGHARVVHGLLSCSECKFTCLLSDDLKEHRSSVHQQDMELIEQYRAFCLHCVETFTTKNMLDLHMVEKHRGLNVNAESFKEYSRALNGTIDELSVRRNTVVNLPTSQANQFRAPLQPFDRLLQSQHRQLDRLQQLQQHNSNTSSIQEALNYKTEGAENVCDQTTPTHVTSSGEFTAFVKVEQSTHLGESTDKSTSQNYKMQVSCSKNKWLNTNCKRRFACTECSKTYSSKQNVTLHYRSKHPAVDVVQVSFTCKHCGRICASAVGLVAHSRIHAQASVKKDRSMKGKVALFHWAKRGANKGKRLALSIGRRICNNAKSINAASNSVSVNHAKLLQKIHIASKDASNIKREPLICKFCPAVFTRKRDRFIHERKEHCSTIKLACKQCGRKYIQKEKLLKHEQNVHDNKAIQMPLAGEKLDNSDNTLECWTKEFLVDPISAFSLRSSAMSNSNLSSATVNESRASDSNCQNNSQSDDDEEDNDKDDDDGYCHVVSNQQSDVVPKTYCDDFLKRHGVTKELAVCIHRVNTRNANMISSSAQPEEPIAACKNIIKETYIIDESDDDNSSSDIIEMIDSSLSESSSLHQCQHCIKVFYEAEHLREHRLSVHFPERAIYGCGNCFKMFEIPAEAEHCFYTHAP